MMNIPCNLIPELVYYGTPVCRNDWHVLVLCSPDGAGYVSCFNHEAGTNRQFHLSDITLDLSVATGILLAEKWLRDHKQFGLLHDLYPGKVSLTTYQDILAQHIVQSVTGMGTGLQGVFGSWETSATGEQHRYLTPNAAGSNAYCRVHPEKGWLFQILHRNSKIYSGPETGVQGRFLADDAASNAGYYCVRN